ncbi:helicase-related protein [Croceicoccus sp. YJ47]|uniref:helicase-related protein n=1 Tax=Croceicoccus sp. YJ47 TaxID=2798724 RepID=UPI00192221B7|nr:helicase-related protein [Croceicoccus sp. YJ47]QQN75492.1 DEAD/DEAH box helicase [Croceicoccus sp. YJ47]
MPDAGPDTKTAAARLTADVPAPDPARDFGLCETAAMLAERLVEGDVFMAARDEPRARAIAACLNALMPDALVAFVPPSDALPGDDAPASPANVGQRVSALRAVHAALGRKDRPAIALVTTGEALARAYPAPGAYGAMPPAVQVGETLDLDALAQRLQAIGYFHDERVDEPGEVALRGQVLDVFPADAAHPLRIEAKDGTVAAIHVYDAGDQRTIEDCDTCEIGRAAEPEGDGDLVPLLAHLPDAPVILAEGADERRRRFLALAEDAASRRSARALRIVTGEEEWAAARDRRATQEIARHGEPPPRFVEAKRTQAAFDKFVRERRKAGDRIVLLGSARDLRFLRRRAARALGKIGEAQGWTAVLDAEPGAVLALPAAADRGFMRDGIAAVAAADLLGSRADRGQDAATPSHREIFDFGEIRVGDVVVHEDHGLAQVAGLRAMEGIEGASGDAIALTYADDNTRLVPVDEADLVWRYGAEADAVTLDRLDGSSWQKRRAEIDRAIADSARTLIDMAKARENANAPVLDPDPDAYERFSAGFPFTETPDQARAIEAVRDDLASGKPMDRLVVGDVGYGKTEVALRAAAIAALSGKQVAIAAPTTVLARQHLEEFRARFASTGIEVAGLSRLSTAAEKKAVRQGLQDGRISIVVGTGAVAGKGVEYADLALVIIDEEQRFGTKDKNALRALSAGHALALSATPIPRTLQTALVGLQQLSVIATPPARRQPIRTAVGAFDGERVRSALLREKARGGQSFVVVPRIEDMEPLSAKLERLVPELSVVTAHGKMKAGAIDEAMVGFARGEGDVLLATNIIEAGLDVPRANTMIIWRADRFGLSQLHQLRGRVGRASRRGNVMLLTDPDAEIAPATLKRLRTLEAFDRLGAGFAISARDLDMRGAGDLLGEAQAGHMKLIGIDLYQFLLESALRTARGEVVERWAPELNLGVEGRLPAEWIPDEEIRVTLYARLARIADTIALDAFVAELEDRFGALPDAAATLIAVARIRVEARAAAIARIDAGPAAIALTPREGFEGDAKAAGLKQKDDRLILAERIEDEMERLDRIAALVGELT